MIGLYPARVRFLLAEIDGEVKFVSIEIRTDYRMCLNFT